MKRLIRTIIILMLFYFGLQVGFIFISGGHEVVYTFVDGENEFKVTEKFYLADGSYYYFEISDLLGRTFSFRVDNQYSGYKHIIKELYSESSSDSACIMPVFTNSILETDIMCSIDNIVYNYGTLTETSTEAEILLKELLTIGFRHNTWSTSINRLTNYNQMDIYENNRYDDEKIILWNYQGISHSTGSSIYDNKPLDDDNYTNKLGVVVGDYYLFPDYDQDSKFDKMYVVDLINNYDAGLYAPREISFTGYILGVVDSKVYYYDSKNQVEWKINPKSKVIEEFGNSFTGYKKYENDEWVETTAEELDNMDTVFHDKTSESSLNLTTYNNIEYAKDSDAFYLTKAEGDNVAIYRIDYYNQDIITKLFVTTEFKNPKYYNGYVYFINEDTLYRYSDDKGLLPLMVTNELLFNDGNIYDIYFGEH